jgi:hypothetical protein
METSMARDPNRLEKQRLRQRAYRARKKAEQRPTNEDLARAVLDIAMTTYLSQGRHPELFEIQRRAARRLELIGFQRQQTAEVWLELQARYEKGWSLLRQRASHAELVAAGLVDDDA